MQYSFARLISVISNFFGRLPKVEIHTDGSSKSGRGSWAYVISKAGKPIFESSKRVPCWDSNVMEFQAAIEALRSVSVKSKISLFSDSRILVDTMKAGKGPPSFQGQINELNDLARRHDITWQWVKAHSGNKFNERCDQLCTITREN